MARFVIRFCAAICTILLVTTISFWGRSYWYNDGSVISYNDLTLLELHSVQGALWLGYVFDVRNDRGLDVNVGSDPIRFWVARIRPAYIKNMRTHREVAGFGWGVGHPSLKFHNSVYLGHFLFLPHWFVALIFTCPLIIWFWRRKHWIRDDRLSINHCPGCNYDLHGNSSSSCPECGTTVQPGRSSP